jgi:hypothetical protein
MLIDASEVEYTYLLLEENFGALYQCCVTPDQKKCLCDLFSAARYACWKVMQQMHRDGRVADSIVSRDLKLANSQLAAILQNLGDAGAFLSAAAEAVRLATALVPAPVDA